jgi:hypothetical protein
MTHIVVGLADLRAALKAVVVHASNDPEDSLRHRVRLTVGTENLTVSAISGSTAGLAIVSIEDNRDGELGALDLAPDEIKKLLGVHPVNKKQPDRNVEIRTGLEGLVTVRDVSGLFGGDSFTFIGPGLHDRFPDLASTIGPLVHASARPHPAHGLDTLKLTLDVLRRFTASGSAYGWPLHFEDPSGTGRASLLVSCGESFLGLCARSQADSHADSEARQWRDAWTGRLPRTAPVPDPAPAGDLG